MYYTVTPFPLKKYPTKAKLRAALEGGEYVDFIVDGDTRHISTNELAKDPWVRLKVVWKDKYGRSKTYAAVSYNRLKKKVEII